MSFFTATANINHKPHVRQKGFAPDDLYTNSNAAFHGKYPSPPLNLPSMDFGDDLAGLMAADANDRSSPQAYQQQQHIHQDDHYRHNIFDTQSPQHSLSLSLEGSSSHNSYPSSHHSYSLSIPKSPPEFASSPSSSSNTTSNGLTSPLLTTLPLVNGNATSRARSHSHSLSHGQQQQHHGHHGHTASLSHSLSHSGALNGNLNPMGSLGIGGGYGMNGMGMNSLGGSMGMMGMGNMGVTNGGLSLGPVQSPTLQSPSLSSNNVNPSLSTSLPSPPPLLASSSSSTTATTTTTNYQDKQSLLANEKRRRRRESHNAVERRRRDNINEKISELATLIPECMLEGGGGGSGMNTNTGRGSSSPTSACGAIGMDSSDPLLPTSYGLTNGSGNGGSNSPNSHGGIKEESNGGVDGESGVVKANKGMILRKSVDYIRYLQQLVTAQGARNRELEQELKGYRRSLESSRSPKLDGYLPGRSEGDDENVDYDHPQHHHHQHHHQQQHSQHHQYHHQPEDMVVDNLGMGMGMEMIGGMNAINGGGGTMHFGGGVDNGSSNASPEDLRGRPRVVRQHPDSDGDNSSGAGGTLKEEDDF